MDYPIACCFRISEAQLVQDDVPGKMKPNQYGRALFEPPRLRPARSFRVCSSCACCHAPVCRSQNATPLSRQCLRHMAFVHSSDTGATNGAHLSQSNGGTNSPPCQIPPLALAGAGWTVARCDSSIGRPTGACCDCFMGCSKEDGLLERSLT